MSRIAALLVLYGAQAGGASVTAEQAIAASRAMTSIGPDPCRNSAGNEEIVVCARRESPYALPLYDPDAGKPEAVAGGGRESAMEKAKDTGAPCRARADPCVRPLPLLTQKF